MKKIVVIIALAAVAVLLLSTVSYLIGTGFHEREDVALVNYSVSEDGTKLTFTVAVPTSMGYVRGFRDAGGGVKPRYLTFYSTFGGMNSSFGAKHEFELELEKDDTEPYFNRPNGGYALVLQKNAETGAWEWPE
ncbi:MAG: hypothetical protein IJ980_05470 [Oscillospiraceae bacterium]|nr:hypothetical protein [Oscillospiraceae bacterium]